LHSYMKHMPHIHIKSPVQLVDCTSVYLHKYVKGDKLPMIQSQVINAASDANFLHIETFNTKVCHKLKISLESQIRNVLGVDSYLRLVTHHTNDIYKLENAGILNCIDELSFNVDASELSLRDEKDIRSLVDFIRDKYHGRVKINLLNTFGLRNTKHSGVQIAMMIKMFENIGVDAVKLCDSSSEEIFDDIYNCMNSLNHRHVIPLEAEFRGIHALRNALLISQCGVRTIHTSFCGVGKVTNAVDFIDNLYEIDMVTNINVEKADNISSWLMKQIGKH
jgi:hypothetical protein